MNPPATGTFLPALFEVADSLTWGSNPHRARDVAGGWDQHATSAET